MSEPEGPPAYEFGTFRLDPRQRLLLSRTTRQPIALAPKVFEMLLYLVERRGQLVEKEELMRAIWPTVVVEENSLNRSISTLRKVLGENPGEHRFIATQPGRGYRFVGEVNVTDGSSQPAGAAERMVAATAAAEPSRDASPSIAVLPFANLTRDPDKEYFSDGMAEELIHRLARVQGLRVAARTSAFAYKGRNTDVRQIARDLGVATVLEGSVRGAGERIRVTAQLVDGQTGYHLWSQSYDREFADLFGLQDELAAAIVPALGSRMHVLLPTGEVSARPTESLEAYELYLQANAIRFRLGEENMRRAEKLYQRAIALDPKFARARSGLAQLYLMAVVVAYRWPEALEAAEHEASRALLSDPNLDEAKLVLAQTNAFRGNWLAAELHFRSADARNETGEVPVRALYLACIGFLDAACRESAARFRAHPAGTGAAASLAIFSSINGNDMQALKHADIAVTLGAGSVGGVPLVYSHAARRARRFEEAAERALQALPAEARADAAVVRQVYAAMGDDARKPAAARALHELQQRADDWTSGSGLLVLLAMDWYTSLGDLDRAYDTGFKALEQFKRSGTAAAWAAMWLPEMRPFHRDPRFQSFCEQLGLMEYWKQFGPPDHFELRQGRLMCLA